MRSLARRCAGEALGTALLLAAIVGSGIMGERLAGGNAAVTLLANSLATGCILYVLIVMLADVSGAHLNPLLSIIACVDRDLSLRALAAYLGAQVAGATAGVMLAHAMFGVALVSPSTRARNGAGQWLAEAVATAGLVLVVRLTRARGVQAVAAAVAAYIAAGYWFTASTSFANPAVTLARALTDTFVGIRGGDVAAFVAAQAAGALIGYFVANALHARADRGHDAATTVP